MNRRNKIAVLHLGTFALVIGLLASCLSHIGLKSYRGRPYSDSAYQNGAQTLPGMLQCEYFDLGGEGVAYHDTDTLNSGSGALNPANGTYLNEFRKNEAVDISYTKFSNPYIDNNPYNFTEIEKNQLYVGWTKPGEWINYSVNVIEGGTYQLGIMYTANKSGSIYFSVDNKKATGQLLIPSTFVRADSVAWRQWHHWNYIKNIATIKLQKGRQIITLHTSDTGEMNYDFINFELKKQQL